MRFRQASLGNDSGVTGKVAVHSSVVKLNELRQSRCLGLGGPQVRWGDFEDSADSGAKGLTATITAIRTENREQFEPNRTRGGTLFRSH
jgi:hypothetical protein